MTLAFVVLALVLIARELQRALEQRNWTRERTSLLNRIVAKSTTELVALERTLPGPKPDEGAAPPRKAPVPIGMS